MPPREHRLVLHIRRDAPRHPGARYASETTVDVTTTRAEIERTLVRYRAEAFDYTTDGNHASVMFRLNGRVIRFVLQLPNSNAREITHTPSPGVPRSAAAKTKAHDQVLRQRWRALLLIIKAKLEAVTAGCSTLEDEFLAHTVIPDGRTFSDYAKPEIDRLYLEGGAPNTLRLAGPAA